LVDTSVIITRFFINYSDQLKRKRETEEDHAFPDKDAPASPFYDQEEECRAPVLLEQLTPAQPVPVVAPQLASEYTGPTNFIATADSFSHLLTAPELCLKIKSAISSGLTKTEAAKSVAKTLMTAPFHVKDNIIAGPVDILDPATTVEIASQKNDRYTLEVKIPHPLDPAFGLVKATNLAFGGIIDPMRPGFCHSLDHTGSTLDGIFGPFAFKDGFKKTSITADYNFLTLVTPCPEDQENEVAACIKEALIGDAPITPEDTALIVECGMEIVRINTAAVAKFHKMIQKLIPSTAANPPLTSTSDSRKGILGNYSSRFNIRAKSTVVMFVQSDKPSYSSESNSIFPDQYIDVLTRKIDAVVAEHDVRSVVRPPVIVASRGNKCNMVMRTNATHMLLGVGVFNLTVSTTFSKAVGKPFAYMEAKHSMAFMAEMKKPAGAMDASQYKSIHEW
jgi:hypothetical protein